MSDWAEIKIASSLDLDTPPRVDTFATGWQIQLERDLPLAFNSASLGNLDVEVTTARLQSRLPKTAGLLFPDGDFLASVQQPTQGAKHDSGRPALPVAGVDDAQSPSPKHSAAARTKWEADTYQASRRSGQA